MMKRISYFMEECRGVTVKTNTKKALGTSQKKKPDWSAYSLSFTVYLIQKSLIINKFDGRASADVYSERRGQRLYLLPLSNQH